MTINPKDYDLDELRKMARKRGSKRAVPDDEEGVPDPEPNSESGLDWDPLEDSEGTMGDDAFRARLYRELMPLTAGSDEVSKPYLSALPETEAAEFLVFEWLEFLLLHGGFRGAQEALTYYESIEWITDDVNATLGDYLLGIEDVGAVDGTDLDVDDHLLSLVYIAKLAGMH
ncbi:MAG: FlaD/FlaE family flagellar protein [Halohasta sp.]